MAKHKLVEDSRLIKKLNKKIEHLFEDEEDGYPLLYSYHDIAEYVHSILRMDGTPSEYKIVEYEIDIPVKYKSEKYIHRFMCAESLGIDELYEIWEPRWYLVSERKKKNG